MDLGKDLKNLLLAGIGAVAVTAEKSQALLDELKSQEIVDDLVKKGELTVEQGKVLNEELKHNVEKKIKDSVTVQVVPTTGDELMRCIEDLTPDQLAALKAKLDALKPEEAAQPEVVEEEEVPVQKDAEQPKEDGNDGADVPADGK